MNAFSLIVIFLSINFAYLSMIMIRVDQKFILQINSMSISDINRNSVNYSYSLEVDIWFGNNKVWDSTLNLQYIKFNFGGMLSVRCLKGFVISKSTSPLFIAAYTEEAKDYSFVIMDSQILFYNKNLEPIDSSCDSFLASYFDLNPDDLKQKGKVNKSLLFDQITEILFSVNAKELFIHKDNLIAGPICPLFFKNSQITKLSIAGLQNNRLTTHIFEFSDMKQTFEDGKMRDLDWNVQRLYLSDIYRLSIGPKVLDSDILQPVQRIIFSGVLSPFAQEDVFKDFKNIRAITILASNLREFLHSSTNEWMAYLNYGLD